MPLPDYFRMKNIFGDDSNMPGMGLDYKNPNQPQNYFTTGGGYSLGQNPPTDDVPNSLSNTSANDDVISPPQNSGGYTPQTRDTEALRVLMNQYPDREKYKPGILRRIGAGFIGFDQGAQAGDKYLNDPYNMAITDWKNRIAPAEQAANLERYGNANMRQSQYQGARTDIAGREVTRKTEQGNRRLDQGDVKSDQAQQKIDQAEERIQLNQDKLDHLKSRQDLTDSEKITLANKYKQEQADAKAEADLTKQTLIGTQKTGQITAKGEVDKDIQTLRGTQAESLAGTKGAEARATKAIVPGSAGSTSQLPSQKKVSVQNKAAQGIRENPSWANYMKTDANGQVSIQPPGRFSGPDQKTYDAMVNYIESGSNVIDLGKRGSSPGGSGPVGKVRVQAPDGKTGTWDYSKGPLPTGFTVVK